MTRVLFPLGHYIGPFHPEKGAPVAHHIVRVCRETPKLQPNGQMQVWTLLHGVGPLTDEAPPWTRSTVDAVSAGLGIVNCGRIIDELLLMGAAIEIDTETDSLT